MVRVRVPLSSDWDEAFFYFFKHVKVSKAKRDLVIIFYRSAETFQIIINSEI